jgi:hypothetical protein
MCQVQMTGACENRKSLSGAEKQMLAKENESGIRPLMI